MSAAEFDRDIQFRALSPEQRELLMIQVAKRYYELDMTMGELAKELGLTRWQASRLLTEAREAGDGRVHATRARHVTLAMTEPFGVMGLGCPDAAPLLAFVSLVMPAIAMGNRVVAAPSPESPLAATDFYQVLDTSDVPAGVVNIVTGPRDDLAKTLAEHDDVAALRYHGPRAGCAMVEAASAGNLKYVWTGGGKARDWHSAVQGQGPAFLQRATQIKNIWIPYGE